MKPDSDLVWSGASHIARTFVVSEQEAVRIAADYAGLIDSKGGNLKAFPSQRFADLLTKELSERYEWRDSAAKEKWKGEQRNVSVGYNGWIESGRSSPFKNWKP
jgi:hypothetical protein